MIEQAMIINAVVLAAVLEADIGSHRKITWIRILRPLIMAGAIVPIYLKGFAHSTDGFLLALILCLVGISLGLVAISLMGVYRSSQTGKPVTRAGVGYAALWILVIGARASFSYGSVHWFGPQLGSWMAHHSISSNALTDGLILMAVGMLVTRTLGMVLRSRRLGSTLGPVPAIELDIHRVA
jgi:hypothetical protein